MTHAIVLGGSIGGLLADLHHARNHQGKDNVLLFSEIATGIQPPP